ncbi:MAG TPA: phosphatidylglycerophosphatase A [Candidatus Omnitrophota bacterium]|nr:phosphatidylglycerophosphatase A [Candidatus Omnitrophota bacterium]
MVNKIARMIATFFYVGEIPIAPGTVASFAGAMISIALSHNLALYLAVFAVLWVIGFLASERTEKIVGKHDPSCVVIDEVLGMMVALFLLPLTSKVLIIAFFLFRAFDMFKIYPANHLEKLRGGIGIIADDLLAGLYTNILMHVLIRTISI